MCKPEPGPRCSHHAYKEYTAAVSALAQATNPDEITKLTARVKEKELIYNTTPKGQNALKRTIMFETDPAVRQHAEQLLEAGINTRERQLAEYRALIDRATNENTSIKSQSATSAPLKRAEIALKTYQRFTSDLDSRLRNTNTLTTSKGNFLILGSKYTHSLKHDLPDELVEKLATNIWEELDVSQTKIVTEMLIEDLRAAGYSGVALVNWLSDDVAYLNMEETQRALSLRLKLKQKQSGTTKWSRGADAATEILSNAGLKNFTVLPDPKYGYLLKTEEFIPEGFRTHGNIYLSKCDSGDTTEKVYIVRRRSETVKIVASVEVRPVKKTFTSYVSPEYRKNSENTGE